MAPVKINRKRNKPSKPKNSGITDDELRQLIVGPNKRVKFSSDDELDKPGCINPLCDHLDYNDENKYEGEISAITIPTEINTLDDLIQFGKSYHCKRNKMYHDLNLETLCKLVNPLTELQRLVGLHDVKRCIMDHILFFLQGFNVKDRCNNCTDCSFGTKCTKTQEDMLHTVISGPPGVGKTELGRIIGGIYKAIGVLSKGHLVVARRSDLIGKFVGHTAPMTQKVIDKAIGGVLLIDEAYSLGSKEGRDSFSKACLDTINQNLTENRDLLCIIVGYKDKLEECFFAHNPGLTRRFPFRYHIKGYNGAELKEIFMMKVKQEGWAVADDTEAVLTDLFTSNLSEFPHFGGDVETLLMNCKIHHGRRQLLRDPVYKKILTPEEVADGFKTFCGNKGDEYRKRKEKEEVDKNIHCSMYR